MVANGAMPDRIPIHDPSDPEKAYVIIGYRGKAVYCPRCQDRHVGAFRIRRTFIFMSRKLTAKHSRSVRPFWQTLRCDMHMLSDLVPILSVCQVVGSAMSPI